MALVAGRILLADRTEDGWIQVDGGRVTDWGLDDDPPGRPDAVGWVVPPLVNAHTHVADAFLRGARGMPTSVPELVGPGGWKHRQLAMARRERAARGVVSYAHEMAAVGTGHFIDFRENGVRGTEFLRDLRDGAPWTQAEGLDPLPATPRIYGRPDLHDFRDEEAEELLDLVDGVGLSGVRDFERRDLESWAEAAHDAAKPWAVHVSEDRHDVLEDLLHLDPAFVVHMCHATARDMVQAAEADLPVVLCPRSNRFFGAKTPVGALHEAGCLLAVGTDNGMLQDGDLLQEASLLRRYAPGLDDEELLRMLTHHGRLLADLPEWAPRKGAALDVVVLPDRPFPLGQSIKPVLAPALPAAPPS